MVPRSADRLGDAALVLFSGGQDSTTCLYWAFHHFDRVEAIGFDYGQRHAVELRQARLIAEQADVPYTVLDLAGTLTGSALTEADQDVNAAHALAPDLPASFVPGRNAVFLSLAAAHAFTRGIHHLVGGMCQTDYSGYPEYPQIGAPFDPYVTVLDLLFAVGPDAPDYVWGSRRARPMPVLE